MIEKICFLFLLCAITVKAQQYCTYGPDIFPWNPYRCPPFLANRTSAQRDEYFAIANNCSAPFSELKKAMVNWGGRLGEGTAVENYIRNVTLFMNSVASSVKNQLGEENQLQKNIAFVMTTDTFSLGRRNDAVDHVLTLTEPSIVAAVNLWSSYGMGGPFKNTTAFNQFGFNTAIPNQYNQNNQNNQQYNPYVQSNMNGQQATWNTFNQQNQFNSNGFTTAQPFGGQFPTNLLNSYNQQGQFNFNGYTSQPYAGQWNNNQVNYNQRNQYCKYGDNIFPWFPYRCPYFLSGLTEVQRDGYFAVANNKTLTVKEMTDGLVKWGIPHQIDRNVSSYISAIDDFYKITEQRASFNSHPQTAGVVRMLSNMNLTQSAREYNIMNVMSNSNPNITTVVEQINRLGSEAEFANFIRAFRPNFWEAIVFYAGAANNNQYSQFGNYGQSNGYGQQGKFNGNQNQQQYGTYGSNPTPGYGQQNQQSNQMGSLLFNGMQLQLPCLGVTKWEK